MPRRLILSIGAAVAVLAAGCALAVQYTGVGYRSSFCVAPADQRDMISRFEDEPLYSVAPAGAVRLGLGVATPSSMPSAAPASRSAL